MFLNRRILRRRPVGWGDLFPNEDSKTRAKDVEYRRGGNGGNTLDVLSKFNAMRKQQEQQVKLEFVGALSGTLEKPSELAEILLEKGIHIRNAAFRGEKIKNPTSWIISTGSSRTIINHNPLIDIQLDELMNVFQFLNHDFVNGKITDVHSAAHVPSPTSSTSSTAAMNRVPTSTCLSMTTISPDIQNWIHFEGRNHENVVPFLSKLSETRDNYEQNEIDQLNFIISVELEKPNKPEMKALLPFADICFFSYVFCQGEGFGHDLPGFLKKMALENHCREGAILIVTSGKEGAYFYVNLHHPEDNSNLPQIQNCFHVPAPSIEPIDTVGAGDTFIAGLLLGYGVLKKPIKEAIAFAVRLASKKCTFHGFQNFNQHDFI